MGRILLGLSCLVVGCATPYQRMGFAGGFRDTEVAPGVIKIEVRGNAFTPVETLEDYFHRRAKAICKPFKYDWRMDSGSSSGPSTFIASPGGGRSTVITEQPGARKGWVTGVIACATNPPPARAVAKTRTAPAPASAVAPVTPPAADPTAATAPASAPAEVQVIDVLTGRVATVPEDSVRGQVSKSRRLALVTKGKVEALTPEGHRVQVEVAKVGAARTLGYRLLSGAELTAESEAAAIGQE